VEFDKGAAVELKGRSMKNITLLALAAITLLGLSACNAISGAGQDVSDIGSDVSAGARGVERSIENQ